MLKGGRHPRIGRLSAVQRRPKAESRHRLRELPLPHHHRVRIEILEECIDTGEHSIAILAKGTGRLSRTPVSEMLQRFLKTPNAQQSR